MSVSAARWCHPKMREKGFHDCWKSKCRSTALSCLPSIAAGAAAEDNRHGKFASPVLCYVGLGSVLNKAGGATERMDSISLSGYCEPTRNRFPFFSSS